MVQFINEKRTAEKFETRTAPMWVRHDRLTFFIRTAPHRSAISDNWRSLTAACDVNHLVRNSAMSDTSIDGPLSENRPRLTTATPPTNHEDDRCCDLHTGDLLSSLHLPFTSFTIRRKHVSFVSAGAPTINEFQISRPGH